MPTYFLTAFTNKGELLLNEKFEANSEQEAKEIGSEILKEHQCLNTAHRLVTSSGRLVLFHR
ncbi:MAG: hypothetical protein C6W58_10960 [Bacillaceae bacterium]|uniref:Uncharacterized protein n=2 Tax=Aeribacillus TaxID=1055323 RepID=A0A163ZVM2_9BACI|nr:MULTISPECIES: YhzD family protein [Aeribacillus]AXI38455.1 hypothetical protein CX649_01605 [Bacillaceae bacterium ZC4]REJ15767.1 MAG: hypothetical protein C6W58_10960 [Bacillaceae bacterium]ASS89371.1 hypothetical protein AP3564_03070 [Aeribacillus pallidus]KZM55445.1 hypothetical protein A3Q35_12125 [Aeribacillus pallidus]MDR9796690.1 YhzD family protein [Aeribacillus pallidus]